MKTIQFPVRQRDSKRRLVSVARQHSTSTRPASKGKKREDMSSQNIGGRIRTMRQQRGISLDQLADSTGLTKSYLSKVERDLSVPSISTALKVADSFAVTVGQLLGQEQEPDAICVVRKKDRKRFMRDGSAAGYNYELIAAAKQYKSMEPFIMRPPLEFQDDRLFEHVGEEFIFVLTGSVEVEFPNRRVALQTGDAVYFDSHIPHRTRSIGKVMAETLVVIKK